MTKLTAAQKQHIFDRIKILDPHGDLLTLQPNPTHSGGTVTYNTTSAILIHESITRLTDEEYVRAYLVVRLVRELGYPASSLELEKTYTIGRPSPTRAQIDIKIWDRRGTTPTTFAIIEAKRPDTFDSYATLIEDQLFSPANQEYAAGIKYAIWYTVDFLGGILSDRAIVIDFRRYHDYETRVNDGEIGHNLDIPIEYGVVRKHRYIKGTTPLKTDVTLAELERLRRDFHNVLWGGAKMGDTDVFNNLLKVLLAKIYDEQTTDEGQPYRFQMELKDGIPETPDEVLAKINRLYREAIQYNFSYSLEATRSSSIAESRFPANKVTYVVEKLEGISLLENSFNADVLGTFFESIVRTGFKQDKGQFFTHANIVQFTLYALELDTWAVSSINQSPPSLPYIIDPSCGSGTFLLEAMVSVHAA
jgi:type I restriction enzyme M protein